MCKKSPTKIKKGRFTLMPTSKTKFTFEKDRSKVNFEEVVNKHNKICQNISNKCGIEIILKGNIQYPNIKEIEFNTSEGKITYAIEPVQCDPSKMMLFSDKKKIYINEMLILLTENAEVLIDLQTNTNKEEDKRIKICDSQLDMINYNIDIILK